MANTTELFGENVFGPRVMRERLSESTFKSLEETINTGKPLDAGIADEVAEAMKEWAMEKGATHYTHWFQPLTGATAEKHDSFIFPDFKGGIVTQFSGDELIQGEPDASSFPSGGLRATFEARGYTGWDPTSPAFIKYDGAGAATLCIPTVFCGYHGEALDKKVPLLRSMKALSEQTVRLGKLFGIDCGDKMAIATLGSEQEYFLLDEELYAARPDLIQTGRTLFGKPANKDQQLDDHYFGSIKSRVAAFMADLDAELWKLGVPAKTRHNEVCPAQFEIAPVFESLNVSVDHNMITMEVLRTTAEKHGFICLLHEKPFAGVNGSGKHNNWSIMGPDGKNWLKPGDTPHANAKFMTIICALMKAVDTHADLLRASVASAGNDHRLGANEAPPAVVSIFLGDCLTDIVEQIEAGGASSSKDGGHIELGVDNLPKLPRGNTDRNRTSPFAFTGNRFEFRAVGSNQSAAGANVVLNTIVAEAFDYICTRLETAVAGGAEFNAALQDILAEIIKEHKRILFDGDGYTAEWLEEAARRGLPNLVDTEAALEALTTDKAKALFSKYGVLSNQELESRYNSYTEAYDTLIAIEAGVTADIAKTMIIPAAVTAITEYSAVSAVKGVTDEMSVLLEKLVAGIAVLEAAEGEKAKIAAMNEVRAAADALEAIVPADLWPLPSYTDMLFI
ncbi:glutamine synthetase III family protein [Tichowtungia aerotolerans]|uniref:Glutamine synthetase type III n=1 Tax=Tichowtungia aerotolerans TaxID=2697043 RepID=A0A6P1M3T3_9BACT|nr:glutamine synthetase III [Tichowtungia aerotolerans]QHI68507.1 glutamine synthetase type III [Tichowtungia aerotolerans]